MVPQRSPPADGRAERARSGSVWRETSPASRQARREIPGGSRQRPPAWPQTRPAWQRARSVPRQGDGLPMLQPEQPDRLQASPTHAKFAPAGCGRPHFDRRESGRPEVFAPHSTRACPRSPSASGTIRQDRSMPAPPPSQGLPPRGVRASFGSGPLESSTDSWRAPGHFRGCWCSARAGTRRGRQARHSCQGPAGPYGSPTRCSRRQTARPAASLKFSPGGTLRRRHGPGEARGLAHSVSTVANIARSTRTSAGSDASFSTTMTSIPSSMTTVQNRSGV